MNVPSSNGVPLPINICSGLWFMLVKCECLQQVQQDDRVLKRKERFGTVTVSSDSLSAVVRIHVFCTCTLQNVYFVCSFAVVFVHC